MNLWSCPPDHAVQASQTVRAEPTTLSNSELEIRYLPITVVLKWREIAENPITLKGKSVTSYQAPFISEYVDTQTGEILPSSQLRNNDELWPTIYASERALQRENILNNFRPEVREFALFVMRFRNQRRGVTPNFEQLVKWYAEIKGKRPDNVRRYLPVLKAAKIIAGDSLLGGLFQIAGKSVRAALHSAEDSNASAMYALLRLRAKHRNHDIDLVPEPYWWKSAQAMPQYSEALCPAPSLPADIKAMIARCVQEHPEAAFA